jgi:error-prone DNA polymerase
MGFYAPAQLVQDARRHGVAVLPPDVNASGWDCTLEDGALRLGLRMVKGLAEQEGRRLAAARPFASVHDLSLDRKDLRCLAAAGALRSLAGHRRFAHWAAAGAGRRAPLDAPAAEPPPPLAAPREGEDIVADYASIGLTLGRHPLALLRKALDKKRLVDSATLNRLAHGRPARVAGLVTCRQRPDTASGVVFVTLEDEAGSINVVVWNHLVQRQKRELLGARLLGIAGSVERDGEVVHLVARRLYDYTSMLGPLMTASRDFH